MDDNDRDENDNDAYDRGNTIKAVQKLLDCIERGDLTEFDEQEAIALRQMARLWIGFESVGMFFSYIKQILIIIGFFVASYFALKGYLIDWAKGIVK